MDADGGEVLGNLPRSRPGKRSDKRAGDAQKRPAAAAERAAESAERRGAAAARGEATGTEPPKPESGAGDPVGEVLRLAGRAAGAGLQLVGGVSREVLRRLPRP
jgi:hypothetical protein